MNLENLWVVVRPSRLAEIGDVCFETDALGLALQFKGGRDPEEIHALYSSRNEAEREAERILTAFKAYDAALRGIGR